MTESTDLYANMRGVGKVGSALTSLVQAYRSYMDPTVMSGQKSPAYVNDLMGEYTIPSMHFMIPTENAVKSPVNFEKQPYNVAHVVNAIHTDLMGMLRNITLETDVPSKLMEGKKRQPEFQAIVAEEHASTSKAMKERHKGKLQKDSPEPAMRIVADLIACCFPQFLPEISFALKDKQSGDVSHITVPNILAQRPVSDHTSSSEFPGGIPIAAIAWGLGEASRGRILGSDFATFIQFIAGTQEGLTDSIEALFKALRSGIPNGKSLSDYLVQDGKALTQVLREESGHMQVMRAMVLTDLHAGEAKAISSLLTAAGVDPTACPLKTEHGPRDIACLLYATNQGLRHFNKLLDGDSELQRRVSKGINQPERVTEIGKKLMKLAEDVSQCPNTEVAAALLRRKQNMATLNSACEKIKYIQTNGVDFRVGTDSPGDQKIDDMLATSLRILNKELSLNIALPEPSRSGRPDFQKLLQRDGSRPGLPGWP